YFTMLGDGRACLLGEYIAKDGQPYDIQLKGSGRTPYSRGGDGKAVLSPMLREYVISEAMKELNIPTTRSLAVTTTGERIMRDRLEEGAVLTRIAKSHIRVGTFQYVTAWGDKTELKTLADYTIMRLYPDCLLKDRPYQSFLDEVVKAQAKLIAQWQLVGFIHGVMNTDNMLISGETIDYGPCAFMDTYDPGTVFSSIDTEGRYAYGNQPAMAAWNLTRFAETLLFLLSDNQEEAIQIAHQSIQTFQTLYQENWYSGMGRKLGFNHVEKEERALLDALHHTYDYDAIAQYQQYSVVPQTNTCYKTYCGT
ncbi:MAG: protein adenylyltransferase SelO family protein, partial [Clostridiales bacterium]|nr:protein adenylyltransferase SelO family protein [Clostridiales bacterium]